jgi:threonine dehydrogenase-like Zn-dependent dehydrogenase
MTMPAVVLAAISVDVAIECSGNQSATAAAMKLLAPGGRHPRCRRLGPRNRIGCGNRSAKEITVPGSYTYTDEFDRAIDLLATGLLVVDDLTSIVTPLPDTLASFEELRAGRIMKALIAPN